MLCITLYELHKLRVSLGLLSDLDKLRKEREPFIITDVLRLSLILNNLEYEIDFVLEIVFFSFTTPCISTSNTK